MRAMMDTVRSRTNPKPKRVEMQMRVVVAPVVCTKKIRLTLGYETSLSGYGPFIQFTDAADHRVSKEI